MSGISNSIIADSVISLSVILTFLLPFLFQMDAEEMEVIKDHRPIGHGPLF